MNINKALLHALMIVTPMSLINIATYSQATHSKRPLLLDIDQKKLTLNCSNGFVLKKDGGTNSLYFCQDDRVIVQSCGDKKDIKTRADCYGSTSSLSLEDFKAMINSSVSYDSKAAAYKEAHKKGESTIDSDQAENESRRLRDLLINDLCHGDFKKIEKGNEKDALYYNALNNIAVTFPFCGKTGTMEQKMADCKKLLESRAVAIPKPGSLFELVSKPQDGEETWLDSQTGNIWYHFTEAKLTRDDANIFCSRKGLSVPKSAQLTQAHKNGLLSVLTLKRRPIVDPIVGYASFWVSDDQPNASDRCSGRVMFSTGATPCAYPSSPYQVICVGSTGIVKM